MGKITDDLKPCPFCGGKPTLHQPRGALGSWISCAQCGLEGPTETGVTEVEATAHWNTRTALSASDALTAGERVGWETTAEWSLERQAFQAAGRADVPKDVQKLVAQIWEQYCLAADPTTSPPASELEALRRREAEVEGLLQEADFWIEGALNCKSWHWDADQHEAATDSLQRIKAARRVRDGGQADG